MFAGPIERHDNFRSGSAEFDEACAGPVWLIWAKSGDAAARETSNARIMRPGKRRANIANGTGRVPVRIPFEASTAESC